MLRGWWLQYLRWSGSLRLDLSAAADHQAPVGSWSEKCPPRSLPYSVTCTSRRLGRKRRCTAVVRDVFVRRPASRLYNSIEGLRAAHLLSDYTCSQPESSLHASPLIWQPVPVALTSADGVVKGD